MTASIIRRVVFDLLVGWSWNPGQRASPSAVPCQRRIVRAPNDARGLVEGAYPASTDEKASPSSFSAFRT